MPQEILEKKIKTSGSTSSLETGTVSVQVVKTSNQADSETVTVEIMS